MVQLGDKSLEAWEVAALQKWWRAHEEHVHAHHNNEDKTFTPYMSTRIKLPAKLESDHTVLLATLETLKTAFAALVQGVTAGPVSKVWSEYEGMMLPHLFEEEMVALPLMCAYFTGAEFGPIVAKVVKQEPQLSMGAL